MSHRRSLRVLVALVGAVALTATSAFAAGLQDPIPDPIPPAGVDIALKTVASGLESPVAAAVAPGHGNDLFVADQNGMLWGVTVDGRGDGHGHGHGDGHGDGDGHGHRDGDGNGNGKWLVADLSGLLVDDLAKVIPGLAYDERGFLGVAFDPRFKHNGLLYTFTSENPTPTPDFTTQPGETPGGGQAVVSEWAVRDPDAKQITVDPASRRVLMRVDKPQFNHNGGELAFGPDKMLYISLGDGGNADDEGAGHVPGGNAQSLADGNVLGKVLRIDPHGSNSANGQYGIPEGNPFVGAPGADEIWAYGFRNPYRFSFDRKSGRLLVADVGQNDIEEVDDVQAGGNYGWAVKEGTFLFEPGGPIRRRLGDGELTRRARRAVGPDRRVRPHRPGRGPLRRRRPAIGLPGHRRRRRIRREARARAQAATTCSVTTRGRSRSRSVGCSCCATDRWRRCPTRASRCSASGRTSMATSTCSATPPVSSPATPASC